MEDKVGINIVDKDAVLKDLNEKSKG